LKQVSSHRDDVFPFFVLPILVTTAELRVLRKGTTLAKVEGTRILADITQKVPYLSLYNSFGEDFVAHTKRQFEELANIGKYKNVANIENRLRASGLEFYEFDFDLPRSIAKDLAKFDLPSSIGKALAKGERYKLSLLCTQFLVCSFDALPEMLNQVKQVIRASLRKRKSF